MADSLKTLNCPACGKPMEKVFIPKEGINIDICTNGCGGIYFDNRELKYFDEKNEDISPILEKLQNKTFASVDSSKERICPNCGAKMIKNFSSVNKSIEIDECYACGGKFLDRDELVKFRAEFDTEAERADATVQDLYKAVGQELAQVDEKYTHAAETRNLGQKLFRRIIGQ